MDGAPPDVASEQTRPTANALVARRAHRRPMTPHVVTPILRADAPTPRKYTPRPAVASPWQSYEAGLATRPQLLALCLAGLARCEAAPPTGRRGDVRYPGRPGEVDAPPMRDVDDYLPGRT